MKFYTYNIEKCIHWLDYSGIIDFKEGMQRINFVETLLNNVPKDEFPLKMLMDARDYKKESPEVHDNLAKISRQKFRSYQEKGLVILAVLSDDYSQVLTNYERWFVDEGEAMQWLISFSEG